MNGIEDILENLAIEAWSRHFQRAPGQVNRLQEMDAELIEIPGNSSQYLAVTIDTVAEEITSGLYQDPFTIGWVTIMAAMSDLAAVGANPLGVVISVSCEPGRAPAFTDAIARGMEEACRKLGIYILGGDTNLTESISLSACCLGLVPRDRVVSRQGGQPGDEVYLIGQPGIGNALGLVRLANLPDALFTEESYRPAVNLSAGRLLASYAACCMDSSDGVFTTLDQLMRLNGYGFVIDCHWERILAPEVFSLCEKTGTPPWMMLAGLHGEFALIAIMDPQRAATMRKDSRFGSIELRALGRVQEEGALTLALPTGDRVNINMAPVRNLLQNINGDLTRYVGEMWALGRRWGLNR